MSGVSQTRGVVATPNIPVRSIAAAGTDWATGTPLLQGVNRVTSGSIAQAVSLPAAIGSGLVIDVHVDTTFFVVVFPKPTEQINQFGASIGYATFPRQRLRFIDVGVGLWDFTTNLPLLYPIYNTITAFAGGGQASATQLGMGNNVIRTCATAGDSVKLPLALGGCNLIAVYNDTALHVDIYPDTGQKINRQANNEKFILPPGKCAIFNDIGPGPDQWVGGLLDAGYPIQFSGKGATFNPADATTYYIGQGIEPTSTQQIQRVRIPRTGTIRSVSISFLNLGAGSAETSSIYFQKNAVTDYLISSSVVNNAVYTEILASTLDIPVVAGDFFEIKWVTPTWVTNPTFVTINGMVYVD